MHLNHTGSAVGPEVACECAFVPPDTALWSPLGELRGCASLGQHGGPSTPHSVSTERVSLTWGLVVPQGGNAPAQRASAHPSPEHKLPGAQSCDRSLGSPGEPAAVSNGAGVLMEEPGKKQKPRIKAPGTRHSVASFTRQRLKSLEEERGLTWGGRQTRRPVNQAARGPAGGAGLTGTRWAGPGFLALLTQFGPLGILSWKTDELSIL